MPFLVLFTIFSWPPFRLSASHELHIFTSFINYSIRSVKASLLKILMCRFCVASNCNFTRVTAVKSTFLIKCILQFKSSTLDKVILLLLLEPLIIASSFQSFIQFCLKLILLIMKDMKSIIYSDFFPKIFIINIQILINRWKFSNDKNLFEFILTFYKLKYERKTNFLKKNKLFFVFCFEEKLKTFSITRA